MTMCAGQNMYESLATFKQLGLVSGRARVICPSRGSFPRRSEIAA